MKKNRILYITFGTVILLVNSLHSFWFLSFTSVLWFFVFKLSLVIFLFSQLLKDKSIFNIPISIYRLTILTSFFLLVGIHKMNFGLLPFSGGYKLIEVCTKEYKPEKEVWELDRVERSERNYGLNDRSERTEIVSHLFLMFDWRYDIKNRPYKSEYNNCSFLGIGEPY